MTLKQIEKIRETIKELEILKEEPTPEGIKSIDDNLTSFFQQQYVSPSLYSELCLFSSFPKVKDKLLSDIYKIRLALEGMLAKESNISEVDKILDLIEEGKKLPDSDESRQKFVAKVFYAYSGTIKFDRSIETLANQSIDVDSSWDILGNQYRVEPEVIQGILHKLSIHAEEILCKKTKIPNKQSSPTTLIINENHNSSDANAENTNVVDVSIMIENARQKTEDAALSDEQHKAVMEKLDELESITKSKESKGEKWKKAKGIIKWLVEQGIQVAGIVLPVLAATIG